MKSIKNSFYNIYALFTKNLCKKHKHKIEFSHFNKNLNVINKFASQCTLYFLKLNKFSRTEHVINEFAKFAFVICVLVMYAFAKCI